MKAAIALATMFITGTMTVLPALAQSGSGSAGGTGAAGASSSGAAASGSGSAGASGPTTSSDRSNTGTMSSGSGTSGTTSVGPGSSSGTDMKSSRGAADTRTDMKAPGTMSEGRQAAGGANRDQVEALQRALKDKGHDPGEIDGVMGPKTRKALRDFQQKEGLKTSGQIDAETRDRLGLQASASGNSGSAGMSSSSASPSSPIPAASSGNDTQGSSRAGTPPKR